MGGDHLVDFEEQNWTWLTEEFMKVPEVMAIWEQFVMDKFCEKMPDEDVIGGDR